jgi:hypothetical protein
MARMARLGNLPYRLPNSRRDIVDSGFGDSKVIFSFLTVEYLQVYCY